MPAGRKVKSSVMINEDVWREIRILALRERKEIGELVEEIFRERLERTYRQRPELLQSPYLHQQASTQSQNQNPTPVEEYTKKISATEFHDHNYQLWLSPPIEFPAHKDKIVQMAKEQENEIRREYKEVPSYIAQTLFLVEKLPNKTYKDFQTLNDALVAKMEDKNVSDNLILKPARARGVVFLSFKNEKAKDEVIRGFLEQDKSGETKQISDRYAKYRERERR